MNVIVIKFGGHTLSDKVSMERAAKLIEQHKKTHCVLVVVSAQGDQTDNLCELYDEYANYSKNLNLTNNLSRDLILATGEQISAALLSMFVVDSMPLACWQIPIHQTEQGLKINKNIILDLFKNNKTPIVMGFQAINDLNQVCTLSRGGSDITAIELAKAFNATCVMYKDVCGVFDKDPKIYADAKHLEHITYTQLLKLAENGAQIVQKEAALLAQNNQIPLIITCLANNHKTIVTT